MPVLSRTAVIEAPAGRVFSHVEDTRNLAEHMGGQGSMPMMSSKLAFEIVSQEPTGIGATYRYSGWVMGLEFDFSETVERYVPGREKVSHPIGTPRPIIADNYVRGILVEPLAETRLRLHCALDHAAKPPARIGSSQQPAEQPPQTGAWQLVVEGQRQSLQGSAA